MEYKFYENGEPIKIGDKILFAFVETAKSENRITYKLIALTEQQFDMFDNISAAMSNIPVLKKRVANQTTVNYNPYEDRC